ncbi:patatin-like phospholipase family protein [Wukongibacter baidiensis]|uniref:patatin-like phospholipase family protein n=1 Tax=Wukongibacter baidiensis TaxID=1723361 RepID=UPI003D7F7A15
MSNNYKNLVFEGGGVLGIAYLGVLNFLSDQDVLQNIMRVAGTSAGAITACLTSFSLPFNEMKRMADTLDYSEIPQKGSHPDLDMVPDALKKQFEKILGDIDCIYRLLTDYGWYSSEYIYYWIREQIASQFNSLEKLPPYTFEDFKNPDIHINQRPFLDLYVIGTDISTTSSKIFSYETTPHMEVAEAIRISMSIPLFFESIKVDKEDQLGSPISHIFADGGIMRNYPISIFDYDYFNDIMVDGFNVQTLGSRFKSKIEYKEIKNFIDYIENLLKSFQRVQQDIFTHSPQDILRSIEIDTKDVSFVDFDIEPGDETYDFLYRQGYNAAKNYFEKKVLLSRFF